jgi:hypothetical protein
VGRGGRGGSIVRWTTTFLYPGNFVFYPENLVTVTLDVIFEIRRYVSLTSKISHLFFCTKTMGFICLELLFETY